MQFVYFLGALVAGYFAVFRFPRLPNAWENLRSGFDLRFSAGMGFICITLLLVAIVFLCLKKAFGRSKAEQ
jgi:hypothetical protein